ncbi:MAG: glycosyltransferase family 2 protein [Nitrospira sp.]|nr:glycosyltransferase family 2 protein [Nitrospira sp.]
MPATWRAGNWLQTEQTASSYWVVIPACNEAATVREVAARARRYCPNVIVVDDASSDGTERVLEGLDVTVLRNKVNCGKAGSLARGFEYALSKGAVGVVTLDADGQHAPEDIPRFFEQARREPNVLLIGARRRDQRRARFWRYAANCCADFWIGIAAGLSIEDSQSGYRLYPSTLLASVNIPHGRSRSFVYESEILIEAARQGTVIRTIGVSVGFRGGASPSHFRPLLDGLRIAGMVTRKLIGLSLSSLGLSPLIQRGGMR